METRRVLIIEDDQEAVRLAVSLLRHEPYRLLYASNPRDALQLARQYTPDVILLSWTLPGITGDEFSELLEQDPVTARIPLVLFSLEPWLFNERTRAKAVQVVNKTYMYEELLPRLRDALAIPQPVGVEVPTLARLRDRSQWWQGEEEGDWRTLQRIRLRTAPLLSA